MKQRGIEVLVGLFVLLAIIALLVLAFRVSGLADIDRANSYEITAEFDNIGSLKVGAPVSIAGVKIGEVEAIRLDKQSFRAQAVLEIFSKKSKLPTDTSASIFTSGILGAQYIGLTPGFSDEYLKSKGRIQTTHSALILESLIGQLIFNMRKGEK